MRFLLRRAEGGFGLITTAASHVQESGQGWEGEFGVWGDHHLPGLTSLATQLKQHASKSFVQIFHGGMRAPSSITGQQASSASVNFISESEGSSRRLSKVRLKRPSHASSKQHNAVKQQGLMALNCMEHMVTLSLSFLVRTPIDAMMRLGAM